MHAYIYTHAQTVKGLECMHTYTHAYIHTCIHTHMQRQRPIRVTAIAIINAVIMIIPSAQNLGRSAVVVIVVVVVVEV